MYLTLFDVYNLRARFSVAMLYALPFIADAVLLNYTSGLFPTTVLTLALIGICQALMGIVRDAGKKKADNRSNPAADLLAPKSNLPPLTKRRYYRKLATMESEFTPFATLLDNPNQLSEEDTSALCYSAIRWLRGMTRDSKTFGLLKEENINYGFRRNLYALRVSGILCNLVALVGILYRECFFTRPTFCAIAQPQVFLHLAMLLYIWCAATKASVNAASDRYADALLESIDLL